MHDHASPRLSWGSTPPHAGARVATCERGSTGESGGPDVPATRSRAARALWGLVRRASKPARHAGRGEVPNPHDHTPASQQVKGTRTMINKPGSSRASRARPGQLARPNRTHVRSRESQFPQVTKRARPRTARYRTECTFCTVSGRSPAAPRARRGDPPTLKRSWARTGGLVSDLRERCPGEAVAPFWAGGSRGFGSSGQRRLSSGRLRHRGAEGRHKWR